MFCFKNMAQKPQSYSTPLIFVSSSSSNNNQDDDINSKYQKRQENFKTDESFEKIKESTMTNELSLGQNFRNKMFAQKRLKKTMNIESTNSLKNKLTISLQLFETCNNMSIEISKFP